MNAVSAAETLQSHGWWLASRASGLVALVLVTVSVFIGLMMAGITNAGFRRLCREYGAGLYVSEMITSRALVERTPESMRLITHHESETPRSIPAFGMGIIITPAALPDRSVEGRGRRTAWRRINSSRLMPAPNSRMVVTRRSRTSL